MTQPDEVRRVALELEQIDRERRATWEEMIRSNPGLASLKAPVMDLSQIAESLAGHEGGSTLLLSFHLGAQHSRLFSLDASGRVEVHEVGGSREELGDLISRFRRLVRASDSPSSIAPIRALGKQLYETLFGGAEHRISGAQRLLLLVEGSLLELPFSALSRADPATGAEQWLIEWKALHTASSGSAYSTLRHRAARDRRERSADESGPSEGLVAFGDPTYVDRDAAKSPSRSLQQSGLSPIPWTRNEAVSVARRVKPSRVVIGNQATELAAREALASAHIAHFAVHGTYDKRLPLDSGLAFASEGTSSENRNGVLQAWEILEEVSVSASLVVLSSCESGLGMELGIEGSFGLPRALQIAGADTVITSLWRISDRSTAALMDQFYSGLEKGLDRDEALRQAQLSLASGPVPLPLATTTDWWERLFGPEIAAVQATHPYHWSGFQLDGDWASHPARLQVPRSGSP